MRLDDALREIPGVCLLGRPNAEIGGIAYDSRSVRSGDLFVAIKGEKSDGARFIPQAIGRGASAVAAETQIESGPDTPVVVVPDAREFLAEISRVFYGDPCEELSLAAITGTNGKTTTSYLMESIYRCAGYRSCVVGTLGMKIGSSHFQSAHTTPESSDLMRFFRKAVTEGSTHGALEVSSHSLALKRVYGMRFRVGVFMNLTRDHLDFHRDMESYFLAKKLLFSEENRNRVEAAVINIDDPYGRRIASETRAAVLSFGFSEDAGIRVRKHQSRVDGTSLVLQTPAGEAGYRLRLVGRPNLYNVMAATGAALSLGIGLDKIRQGVEGLEGVPGRVERVDAGQDFTVIVDYAHSPDSLENLLNTVSRLPHARLITVFGCGGDRDRTKRPIMGEIAVRLSDFVFATSDNPRSEDPIEILDAIETGLRKGPAPYRIEPDRRKAIEAAVTAARTGDVVVIAGKGHEDYQILADRTIPFDDRKLAGELIRDLLKKR